MLRILRAALTAAPFVFSHLTFAAVNTVRLDAPASRRNTEASAHPDGPRDTGKAQPATGQAARTNSDRVRSLLNRQAPRPRTAVAASRRGAAPTAVAGVAPRRYGDLGPGVANLSQGRANPSPGSASAAPNRTPRRAAVALPQNSAAGTGTLGGARAQGHARLGGPASGKAVHAAVLDGTQLHRKH
jgi:hypothetical protein